MEREALKLALEALENHCGNYKLDDAGCDRHDKAITAIKAALAQPADNPYGYDWSMLEAAQESLREHMARIKELEAQLAQPAQEPTDNQVEAAIDAWFESSIVEQSYQSRMRAAFAAAHNIRAKP